MTEDKGLRLVNYWDKQEGKGCKEVNHAGKTNRTPTGT